MKYLLSSLIFILTSGLNALACSPPPDMTYVQPSEYLAVIQSSNVVAQLRSIGGKDIVSIKYDNGEYIVNSSNGCFVKAEIIYSAPISPGMCPSLSEVKIKDSKCL